MHATILWVLSCLMAAWIAAVASHSESSGSSWLDLCESMLKPVDTINGISVMNDSSCLTNATQIGCFLQTCRYCRVNASSVNEQSKFYPACDEANSSHTESVVVETTSTNSTIDSSSSNDTTILCSVSKGDAEIGLDVFYDESCPGLGCIEYTTCRYCKLSNITQNEHLAYGNCPSKTEASAACSSYITMTGVSSVTESSCQASKPRLVGCVAKTSCRLCRSAKTQQNQYLVSCQVLQDEHSYTTSVAAYAAAEPATIAAGTSDGSVALAVIGAVAGAIAAALLVAFVMRRNGDADFDPLRDGSLVQIIGKERIAEL